jgi:hypothetical protein
MALDSKHYQNIARRRHGLSVHAGRSGRGGQRVHRRIGGPSRSGGSGGAAGGSAARIPGARRTNLSPVDASTACARGGGAWGRRWVARARFGFEGCAKIFWSACNPTTKMAPRRSKRSPKARRSKSAGRKRRSKSGRFRGGEGRYRAAAELEGVRKKRLVSAHTAFFENLPPELKGHVNEQMDDCEATTQLCSTSKVQCDDKFYVQLAQRFESKGTDFFTTSPVDPLWSGVSNKKDFDRCCSLSLIRSRIARAMVKLDAIQGHLLADPKYAQEQPRQQPGPPTRDIHNIKYEFTVDQIQVDGERYNMDHQLRCWYMDRASTVTSIDFGGRHSSFGTLSTNHFKHDPHPMVNFFSFFVDNKLYPLLDALEMFVNDTDTAVRNIRRTERFLDSDGRTFTAVKLKVSTAR